jgi:hypothetical protein
VRKILAERYVLPAKRPALDAALAEGLRSGRYRTADPALLAQRIDEDLARVGQDRHLNIALNPAQARVLAENVGGEAPDDGAYARAARDAAHGLQATRLLPGNVRYLDYVAFHWTGAETAAAIDRAMAFLAGGEAAIIDLRRNGGGSPDAVQRAISPFLEPGRPLMTFYMNGDVANERTAAVGVPPESRMAGKPLYVLVGGNTASAAEEFAGHVAGYRLGELVGDTTAGAGFRNELFPVGGAYVLSVSVGRAVLESTQKDWERVGIAPTIRAEPTEALQVAHAAALRRLAAAAPEGARRTTLTALAEAADAARTRPAPAQPLAAYAGSYGIRTITLRDGRLHHQRERRFPEPLIALGDDLFALENDPSLRLRFTVADGRATGFGLETATGDARGTFARD